MTSYEQNGTIIPDSSVVEACGAAAFSIALNFVKGDVHGKITRGCGCGEDPARG